MLPPVLRTSNKTCHIIELRHSSQSQKVIKLLPTWPRTSAKKQIAQSDKYGEILILLYLQYWDFSNFLPIYYVIDEIHT